MTIAWLAYLPIPGLALVQVLVDPYDRSGRFHAWQGGTTVLLLWLLLFVVGLLAKISTAAAYQMLIGVLAIILIFLFSLAAIWGGIAAARERYVRIPVAYQLLTLLGR